MQSIERKLDTIISQVDAASRSISGVSSQLHAITNASLASKLDHLSLQASQLLSDFGALQIQVNQVLSGLAAISQVLSAGSDDAALRAATKILKTSTDTLKATVDANLPN